jgi:hypothetical protein
MEKNFFIFKLLIDFFYMDCIALNMYLLDAV